MGESQGNVDEFEGPDSHVRIRVGPPAETSDEALFDALDRFTHPRGRMNDAILNTALIRNLRTARLHAKMGESRCGILQPEVEVRFDRGSHYRKSNAALHALAAAIELATPTNEGWIVQVNSHSDEVGFVYLELARGDQGEARRGLELLKRAIA